MKKKSVSFGIIHCAYPVDKIQDFLKKFETVEEQKYLDRIQQIANRQVSSITIELDDLEASPDHSQLVVRIQAHAHRYEDLFYKAINKILNQDFPMAASEEPVDVIIQQRLDNARQRNEALADGLGQVNEEEMFPQKLMKRYSVYFKPLTSVKPLAVREAKAASIGNLVSIRGMVTRVMDVKPKVVVATYTCSICNFEIFQEVLGDQFLPVQQCPSKSCEQNKKKGELTLQMRGSRFVRFQEAKIQELTDQVPMGHIPRSMTVHLMNDLTRSLSPGDEATVSGVFLPQVYKGFRAIKAGLLTDTYLEVMHVELAKKQYSNYEMTEDVIAKVHSLADQPNTYERLASSIAPEIFGHDDVKKAVLLLMVGGVTKNVRDGMKIRGDINICLMGDPGVAKSQLLKWVSRTAPRGVYTTGKGSSGVGLTAVSYSGLLMTFRLF
jgi:DNA replication licensing factor MCM7